MSFSLDVGKWAEEAGEDVAEANAMVITSLFRGVIKDTPVLEGRLRASWIPSEYYPAGGKAAPGEDITGVRAIARAINFVDRQDLSGDFEIYLTNNLPYAHRVEYDGWSHTKAPAGMVRTNLRRIAATL